MSAIKKIPKEKLFLIILIFIQVVYLSVYFAINKQGYHSDEMWNYGFANSTKGPHIYIEGTEVKNCLEWVDSKKLLEYISVDKSEIFSYADIYKNASEDLNPPFQYFLLHFICSFFPNIWSKWFCFVINIAAFILTQIFLYKNIKAVTKNESVSIAGVFMYGFCVGTINIVSFLRIYALGVAFVTMFSFYSYEAFNNKNNSKAFIKSIIKASIVCLLGALTIHFFLIVAFMIVLMYSIYYLFSKRIKAMFIYGLSMLSSVTLSILAFPSVFSHLFGYSNNFETKKYPTLWQFKIYWSFLTKDVSGLHNSAIRTMTFTYFVIGLVILAFILIPLCFISRNEAWFKKCVQSIKERASEIIKSRKHFPYIIIVLIATINFTIFICANNSSVFLMGIYARRYIFLIYPLFCELVVILFYYIIRWITYNTKIRSVIYALTAILCCSLTYVFSSDYFCFKYHTEGVTLDKLESDANCIIVLSDLWLLTCATNRLYNTNSFFATQYLVYEQGDYEDGLDTEKPLYLLVDISNFSDPSASGTSKGNIQFAETVSAEVFGLSTNKDEIIDYYKNLPFTTNFEYVGQDVMYDRIIEIYRLN